MHLLRRFVGSLCVTRARPCLQEMLEAHGFLAHHINDILHHAEKISSGSSSAGAVARPDASQGSAGGSVAALTQMPPDQEVTEEQAVALLAQCGYGQEQIADILARCPAR